MGLPVATARDARDMRNCCERRTLQPSPEVSAQQSSLARVLQCYGMSPDPRLDGGGAATFAAMVSTTGLRLRLQARSQCSSAGSGEQKG